MNLKNKFNEACADMQIWWSQNSSWAMVVIPASVALFAKGCNTAVNIARIHHNTQMNKKYYDRQIWDAANGVHITTKKAMSAQDKLNFANLKQNGASTIDALKILNLV